MPALLPTSVRRIVKYPFTLRLAPSGDVKCIEAQTFSSTLSEHAEPLCSNCLQDSGMDHHDVVVFLSW